MSHFRPRAVSKEPASTYDYAIHGYAHLNTHIVSARMTSFYCIRTNRSRTTYINKPYHVLHIAIETPETLSCPRS